MATDTSAQQQYHEILFPPRHTSIQSDMPVTWISRACERNAWAESKGGGCRIQGGVKGHSVLLGKGTHLHVARVDKLEEAHAGQHIASLPGKEGVLLIADARLEQLQEAGANRCETAVGERDLCGESRGGAA